MIRFSVFVSVAAMIAVTSGTNYCSQSLCSPGQRHIACGHNGQFSASCPGDAEMVNIDNNLKQVLLDAHNEKRNLIAGGGAPKHGGACRMATMQWDNELAQLASLNVRQCQIAHDQCHNTDAFKFSGQNLAWFGYTGMATDNAKNLRHSVKGWYDEVQFSNKAFTDKYPAYYYGPDIGHFTAMVNDASIRVGCGAATYTEGGFTNYLVACNYARTNIVDYPVYESCSTPASKCTTGTNPKYHNLCSVNEKYDVNKP